MNMNVSPVCQDVTLPGTNEAFASAQAILADAPVAPRGWHRPCARSSVMIRAYTSEWLKIRRPATLVGGAGTMIGIAVLAIVLTLRRLGSTGGSGGGALTAALQPSSRSRPRWAMARR